MEPPALSRDDVPLIARVKGHGGRLAIVDPAGMWSFADLYESAGRLAGMLLVGDEAQPEARVALLCTPGRDYVVALLACWRAGAVAVPLLATHPDAELAYFLEDAGVSAIASSPIYAERAERIGAARHIRLIDVSSEVDVAGVPLPTVLPDQRALMVYTSGTTGKPKGVVHTHGTLAAMASALIDAWAWSPDDRILLVLPLHHVHGIVNVVCCALWAGAVCEAPGSFDARDTWERLASGDVTLFMAVPTVYARLVHSWEQADDATRARWSAGAASLRLMVSGSAALPIPTLDRWRDISGHVLLERYGMTEIGMALSNTLGQRVAGHVGHPLPGVQVRLVNEDNYEVAFAEPGELLVRGPQVFAEYWGRPDATAASFIDGWFRTGDVAVRTDQGYRLLGRSSVDILKTGGEKVSALEIEDTFRLHPAVVDIAVVGVPDVEWGERVCAAVVVRNEQVPPEDLRAWGKERLAVYKVPQRFVFVDDLPRNTMGKVTKAEVARLFAQ